MGGWNGSGVFSRTYSWVQDQLNGIKIRADRHDVNDTDFVNGINNCLTKDGQNAATADLPMGTYKHTNVGKATALNQYATAEQFIDNELIYYTASGTDTYTITPSPAITTYAAGQEWLVKFTNANTGAATINVNSLGAKSLVKGVSTALVSGDIEAGSIKRITYDGTNFIVSNANTGNVTAASNLTDNAIVRGDGGGKGVQTAPNCYVDDNGRVLIGGATALSPAGQTPYLQMQGTSGGMSAIATIRHQANSSGALLIGAKSRSASIGSNTIVQNGDTLFEIQAAADDGTDLATVGAAIQMVVDGTPGANDMPTKMVLAVTADGANSPTAALTINNGRDIDVANRIAVGSPTAAASPATGDVNAKRFLKDGVVVGVTLGTPVATTSGTSVSYTSIPAGVSKITVMLNGVSTNGTSRVMLQLGDSGGLENTGYVANGGYATNGTEISSGFPVSDNHNASDLIYGTFELTRYSGNEWICSWNMYQKGQNKFSTGNGVKTLSATLDRVALTTVGGTDAFDAGAFNVTYE